eukprot:TRINITY_DN3874_c0_g1_i1.p1 TRINITY_DN3874_c0_g1~~TRINITY_DN3874_c0_g1_i1.p1  ORF type:complete len:395 (-),score=38.69 TRINITY_DN3874_c0_g1_i1:107-1291(-)
MLTATSLRVLGLRKGPTNCKMLNGLITMPAMFSARQLSMPVGATLPQAHVNCLIHSPPQSFPPPSRLVLIESQFSYLSLLVILSKMGRQSSRLDLMLPLRHRSSPCQASVVDSAAAEQVLEAGFEKHAGAGGTAVPMARQRATGRADATAPAKRSGRKVKEKPAPLPAQDSIAEVEMDEELDAFLVPTTAPAPAVFGPASMVLGVDPDISGALAVLRGSLEETSAQVLDVPFVRVKIGATMRRRHDPGAMAAMIRELQPPPETVVYIEQPRPFPLDGKQGWYSAGYGFGVWMGVLHALQLQVVPVHPANWKRALGLAGRGVTKDDSRELAVRTFPSLLKELRRKKDHGRAEALLIAQHGRMLAANLKLLQRIPREADSAQDEAVMLVQADIGSS